MFKYTYYVEVGVMWEKSRPPSNFRIFVTRMWAEHAKERRSYGESSLTIEEYFKNYKFWLKRVYRDV